jgi:hypothetical protein
MSEKTAAGGQAADKQPVEEEFVVVEVDEKGQPIAQADDAGADDGVDDDVDAGDDDPSDDVDERLGHEEGEDDGAHAGETPEEKRERRRRENRTKRIRNRVAAEAKDRLIQNQGTMLLNLQEQVAKLQGRTVQYDVNLLQNQIDQIESQQRDAKSVLAKLSKAQDHDGIAEVVEVQMNLRDQHRTLSEQLRRASAAAKGRKPADDSGEEGEQPTRGQPRRQAPDPEVVRRAQSWAAKHKWAHPRTGDPEEVEIMRAIDHTLSQEGWDARSDEYWTELTNRAKRRLPHHFKQKAAPNGGGNNGGRPVNNGGKPASGGPRMAPASQGGGQRPLGKNEVRVTPARKEAMKAAGKWDDPVKRNRQLAAYAKYDRDLAEQQ